MTASGVLTTCERTIVRGRFIHAESAFPWSQFATALDSRVRGNAGRGSQLSVSVRSTDSGIQRRAGFSLIEVVVVIAVISVLLAIGVPALQSLRESSRRVECLNRLRQIGVALLNHHETRGAFPVDGDGGWGYAAFLLPSLEQTALFTELSPLTRSREAATAVGATGLLTVLTTFVCPNFRSEATLRSGGGRSNYPGSAMMFSEQTRRSDIYDGEGQTIAVGETTSEHGWIRPGTVSMKNSIGQERTYGSRHAGMTHFLFCDGTVRGIADSVDPKTFEALLTPVGREAVGDF